MQTLQSGKIGVLSIQLPMLGHKTFCGLMRRSFANSDTIELHSYWIDEKLQFYARIANRLLRVRLPFQWARDRNVDLRRVRGEIGFALHGRGLAKRMSRRFQVDVLHFHTQTAALLSTDLMKEIPTVITCDTTAMQVALDTSKSWRWTHAPAIPLERAPLRHAAAVVPWSRWAAKSLIEGHGVAPERVHLIPVGVPLADFAGIDGERRRRDGKGPLRILFVGGDFARKGGPLLVDVFLERFASRGFELHLVTAESSIVVDHPQVIVHRGVIAYSPEWKRLFAEADVFVLPTRSEPFGIVFVEAMAAGLPVIGTSINAIPEIVVENETGFLVAKDDRQALAERLELLLTNATLRQRLGHGGRRRVAALFDAEKTAAQLERVFLSVAHAKSLAR